MNVTARDPEEVRRLALALALALGVHIGLLLGVPTEGWLLHQSRPLRFDVLLLPPVERPERPAPLVATAPEPSESPAQAESAVTGAVPEPVIPPPELQPAPAPSSLPVSTSPPAPPPQPAAASTPAPKPVAPRTAPARPPVVAAITPAPAALTKPAKPATSPIRPTTSPRKTAVAEPSSKLPMVKSPPTPRSAPAETFSPFIKQPPTGRVERPGRGGARAGATGRLDSAALLNQIAGLDAETQRRVGDAVRERRVSLADTRSLAGFYAADWARKVTRVGEMNFPEAARRLNPGAGPLLDVAIRADGSLRNVRVLRSSGNAELDQAARRIVQLAAPYPPFPPELRQQVELLRIEAPWRFDPRGQVQVR